MTVIKEYNSSTSQWETIVVGKQGPVGPTGATGATGAGVPVGGTETQVLSKTSSSDYATAWTTVPDNRYTDGGTATKVPFGTFTSQSTMSFSNDGRAIGFLAWLDKPWFLTNLSVIVNIAATDAGQLLRLGVYEDTTQPTVQANSTYALVADAGTVLVTSQGTKTATLGTPITLAVGKWYWVVAQPEASKTNQPTLGAYFFVPSGVGGQSVHPLSNNWRSSVGQITHTTDTSAQVAGGLAASRTLGRRIDGAGTIGPNFGHIAFGGTWA